MFERIRIGGALYNACDALARDGSPVDRRLIRSIFEPAMSPMIRAMRARHLSAEDAAAALVVSLTNVMHRQGSLRTIFDQSYNEFRILYLLHCYFYNLIEDHPERFGYAQSLLDADVTAAIHNY